MLVVGRRGRGPRGRLRAQGARRRSLHPESNARPQRRNWPARRRRRVIKRADLRKTAIRRDDQRHSGWHGRHRECPLKDDEIQAKVVFDMVYDPAETHLLQVARAKGIAVIPGVEMFVHQAARQFEIWTGKPAPSQDMFRVVTIALQDAPGREPEGK